MIGLYLESRGLLLRLRGIITDALRQSELGKIDAAKALAKHAWSDFELLKAHLEDVEPPIQFGNLSRHLHFADKVDFIDLIQHDLPSVEEQLDALLRAHYGGRKKGEAAPYIHQDRIDEIAEIAQAKFDTKKLLRLLDELNTAHSQGCYFTVGILVRAIMDHLPPIFGCRNFSEIANNYSGTMSFKKSMGRLDQSLRHLADSYLHIQIRRLESLPNHNQVDFRSEVDLLLGEAARLLQGVGVDS
jgi:hypothetical protein